MNINNFYAKISKSKSEFEHEVRINRPTDRVGESLIDGVERSKIQSNTIDGHPTHCYAIRAQLPHNGRISFPIHRYLKPQRSITILHITSFVGTWSSFWDIRTSFYPGTAFDICLVGSVSRVRIVIQIYCNCDGD